MLLSLDCGAVRPCCCMAGGRWFAFHHIAAHKRAHKYLCPSTSAMTGRDGLSDKWEPDIQTLNLISPYLQNRSVYLNNCNPFVDIIDLQIIVELWKNISLQRSADHDGVNTMTMTGRLWNRPKRVLIFFTRTLRLDWDSNQAPGPHPLLLWKTRKAPGKCIGTIIVPYYLAWKDAADRNTQTHTEQTVICALSLTSITNEMIDQQQQCLWQGRQSIKHHFKHRLLLSGFPRWMNWEDLTSGIGAQEDKEAQT